MASRRRFLVPVVVTGLIAVGAAVPSALAGSTPTLPAVTASQLVADVLHPQVPALSGTIEWAPQLGLPAIGPLTSGGGQGVSSTGAFDPVTLLTSDETFRLWIDGSSQRIAAVSDLAETDIVHVGNQVWVWDSATQHVTHYEYEGAVPVEAGPPTDADPQAFAAQLLTDLESAGTTVSVGDPVDVAGRSAYVLRLAPTDADASTVSFIDIAIDAATHAVLQVSVEAAAQAAPALQVGFTSVSFAAPAAGAFTPPHGTTASTKRIGPSPEVAAAPRAEDSPPTTIGHGWSTVLDLHGAPGPDMGQIQRVATPVSGAWGSGSLITSSLLNALLLPNGQLFVGFVPVAVLEAAAASAGS